MNTQTYPALATLANYTKPGLILPQLVNRAIAAVMQELAEALHQHNNSVPTEHLFSSSVAALHRELLVSRIADLGTTFPHVRVASPSRHRATAGDGGIECPPHYMLLL